MKQVTVSADDFGLSTAVNEAVEIAHRDGVLQAASLMVGAPATADAVRRARAMPRLRVGLHLVVIEGQATLPAASLPEIVDPSGWFGSDQFRRGVIYAASRAARAQLQAEIAAQFDAFARTGLALDHANAHKHMHLHPVVGAMMITAGRRHGLARVRVPREPAATLVACGDPPGLGARALQAWTAVLRRQVRRAGMIFDDQVFGLHGSGHMARGRVLRLLGRLPAGRSEIYFHPATHQDDTLRRLMPGYDPAGELACLCDPAVAEALARVRQG